jgi:hypothetical protein
MEQVYLILAIICKLYRLVCGGRLKGLADFNFGDQFVLLREFRQ